MTAPNVAICVPFYRVWEAGMGMSLANMMAFSASRFSVAIIGTSGCYVEGNRNGCIEYAMMMEEAAGKVFDWALWLDTDMIFPHDTLLRLVAHDKDIVGCNYRTRTPPFKAAGHYLDGDDTPLMVPGLHEMAHLPTGVLLTRFSLYRELSFPWFEATARKDLPRDDVYFCRTARAAGHQIWCDHDLTAEVRHIAMQEIPWFPPEQIQVAGTQLDLNEQREMARERAAADGELYKEGRSRAA